MKEVVKALAEAKKASDGYLTPIINGMGQSAKQPAKKDTDESMEESKE